MRRIKSFCLFEAIEVPEHFIPLAVRMLYFFMNVPQRTFLKSSYINLCKFNS